MTQHGATVNLPQNRGLPTQRSMRHRRGRLRRRLVLGGLFTLLVGIIWGYWTVTDSDRICAMAESYLSQIVGGRVEIDRASVSVFEGLLVEGVTVWVDDGKAPDSKLFTARSLQVRADLKKLLAGKHKLEATQIMAVGPQLHLCEDVATGRWNYQRLVRQDKPRSESAQKQSASVDLPEILLRAGLVEYSRIIGGQHSIVGTMAIDGQLTPASEDQVRQHALSGSTTLYAFDLDSRAPGEPSGPRLRGLVDPSGPWVEASLENLEFDQTIRLMLPAEVQRWWATHQLAGRIRIPKFRFGPGGEGKSPAFEIELELQDVRMTILPEELMGHRDYRRQKVFRPGVPVAAASPFELTGRTDVVAAVTQPLPISLRNVSGRLVFTPQQIRFRGLSGKIEDNRLRLDGTVDGYTPNAPIHLRLTAYNMYIPPSPRYLPSMPADARREYAKFRPMGKAHLGLELRRDRPGGYLEARLELHVLDGGFRFEEFNYPLRHVRGSVAFGRDPRRRSEWVYIRNLIGHGQEGTYNQDKAVRVHGWVAPLRRFSGIDVHITGHDIRLDEPLRAALPEEAREVLGMFDRQPRDDERSPVAPMFLRGGLDVHLHRQEGTRRIIVDADVTLADGAGEFREFPYPLRNVTGDILIRRDHVALRNLVSQQGDAVVKIDGKVLFGSHRPVQPELTITARHIPIDQDLLDAVPADPRQRLQDVDLKGWLDVDGRIFLSRPPGSADDSDGVDFDLQMTLNDGRIWPVDQVHAVTDMTAGIRLSRSRMLLDWAQGKRGDAKVTGHGRIAWPDDQPEFNLTVQAENLRADKITYGLVPSGGARDWWDQMRPAPDGRADVTVIYSGRTAASDDEDDPVPPATSETLTVAIRPRSLPVTPAIFPWRLEAVGGELRVSREASSLAEAIRLDNVVFRHGKATVTLSGTGGSFTSWHILARDLVENRLAYRLDPLEMNPWTLQLAARGVALDDDFRRALPPELNSLLKSIKFQGGLAVDCPSIIYRTSSLSAASLATRMSPATNELEAQTKITVADSTIDMGIPVTGANGTVDLSLRAIDGDLDRLSGNIHMSALQVAGRPIRDLRTRIMKGSGRQFYQFADLQALLGGGRLYGQQIDLDASGPGPSRYALRLDLKDAEIPQIMGETPMTVRGRMNASLYLQGNWEDPRARRGTGSVQVQGNNLYTIPVFPGLFQIVNLSLPGKSPFTEATADYIVEGQRLRLDKIMLRSKGILMQGSGEIDMAKRTWVMAFIANNPRMPSIDWIDKFKQEVFQIRVSGKVEEPKVTAKAMHAFTTTVDQVFRGEPERPKKETKSKSKKSLW